MYLNLKDKNRLIQTCWFFASSASATNVGADVFHQLNPQHRLSLGRIYPLILNFYECMNLPSHVFSNNAKFCRSVGVFPCTPTRFPSLLHLKLYDIKLDNDQIKSLFSLKLITLRMQNVTFADPGVFSKVDGPLVRTLKRIPYFESTSYPLEFFARLQSVCVFRIQRLHLNSWLEQDSHFWKALWDRMPKLEEVEVSELLFQTFPMTVYTNKGSTHRRIEEPEDFRIS